LREGVNNVGASTVPRIDEVLDADILALHRSQVTSSQMLASNPIPISHLWLVNVANGIGEMPGSQSKFADHHVPLSQVLL
jgi:hypothetical protein